MPKSIIEEEIKNTTFYMKRIFWFIVITLVIQIVQQLRLVSIDKWLSVLVIILMISIPSIFILFNLYKTQKTYQEYLETHRKINLEQAIESENCFFMIIKICSWLLVGYIFLFLGMIFYLSGDAYFYNL